MEFSLPRHIQNFLALELRLAMLATRFFASDHCKDCAVPLSVRGFIRVHFCPLTLGVIFLVYMTGLAAAAQRGRVPDDLTLTKAIESYFASQPGYQKGDLITRSQVEKFLAKLQAAGVKLSDAASIAKLGLPDESFIVRELSTPDGRRFMRKIAHDPGTYARLDRLSTIPRGQTTIRDLVRQKDGDKLIEYMATTKGGKAMGGMMAGARGGVDLNKSTGRIYTADDLIAVLKAALAKPAP
jgi:hypothetical protein